MGFMGNVFKFLGFEGESKPKTSKKTQTKATYKLKNANMRPDQIDGVPVYYPEKKDQIKEFLNFVKNYKAIIISLEYCPNEDMTKSIEFIRGFAFGANAKFIPLNDEKQLYLILPEGMEVEG